MKLGKHGFMEPETVSGVVSKPSMKTIYHKPGDKVIFDGNTYVAVESGHGCLDCAFDNEKYCRGGFRIDDTPVAPDCVGDGILLKFKLLEDQ